MTDHHYKRGSICKDGKLYGYYPDGSLYRIYSTTERQGSCQVPTVQADSQCRDIRD